MGKKHMSKTADQNKELDKSSRKSSKKKYLLMGGLFVVCALFLKRDAH